MPTISKGLKRHFITFNLNPRPSHHLNFITNSSSTPALLTICYYYQSSSPFYQLLARVSRALRKIFNHKKNSTPTHHNCYEAYYLK